MRDVNDLPTGPDRPAARAPWPVLVVVVMALVLVVNSVDYLPTNDGPEAVFAAHVYNHHSRSELFQSHFELLPQYAYRGFSTLLIPLQAWLPWNLALRVALSVVVTGSAAAGWALLGSLHPARRWLLPMLGATALSWSFFMGFFSYVVGVALGTGVIAAAAGPKPLTPTRRALLALALFVLSVSHMFAACITGAVVALVLVARATTWEARAREAVLATLVGIPAFSVAILTWLESTEWLAEEKTISFLSLPELWSELPRLVLPGTGHLGWLCLVTCLGSVVFALVRWRRGDLAREERGLVVAAVALFAASVATPFHLRTWQFLSPRFLPFAVTVSLALLPFERLSPRALRGAVVAVAVAGLASFASSAALCRQLEAGCGPSLAVLSADLPRGEGVSLPLALNGYCGVSPVPTESEVPHLSPLLHFGSLFAAVRGGSTVYVLSGKPSIHLLRYRKEVLRALPIPQASFVWQRFVPSAATPSEAERQAALRALLPYATRYERTVLIGVREDEALLWQASGFDTEWRGGAIEVVRFGGCPVTVTIPKEAARETPVLELGVQGMQAPLFGGPVAPLPNAPPGPVPFRFERQWCGPLWVRVWWDRDRSNSLSPGDAVCARAGADGRVEVVPTREGVTVACEPRTLASTAP